MTINNKDDYEKLAKILYPSIEASGNVYYGQTRKLTMDEILGKNELNFESHIESFKQGDQTYKSYFNWQLGPLNGSVQVVPIDNNLDGRIEGYQLPTTVDPLIRDSVIRLYKDGSSTTLDVADEPALYIDGAIFIKYRLNIQSEAVEQLTNSGSFPVYENKITPVFECFVVTDWFDPSNVDAFNIYDIKDRNFFIEYKDNECYLYIQLMSDEVQSPNVKIDLNQPMTFIALQPNSQVNFRWTHASSYEINQYNGYGWVSIPDNDHTVVLQNKGDKVSIRYSDAFNTTTSSPRFYLTGSIKASGNICSLLTNLYSESNSRIDFTAYNLTFAYMFQNETALTDVSELYIYISLASYNCCAYMFDGCTNILYPPKLTIAYTAANCFEAMFNSCTKLKYAPELLATDLTSSCYYMMFAGCTSLISTTYLPATVMKQHCYDSMFSGCTHLKYAMAILPAKRLDTYCYNSMFSGCASLRIAPILPAISTPRDCYSYMFSGCSDLSYVCCLIDGVNTDYPPTITDWLDNVAATGKLLVLNNAPQHLVDSLPTGWQLIRLTSSDVSDINNIEVRHPAVGFNCRLSNSEEPNKYFYVATSGADSANNGRGKLNSDTVFNMLITNPVFSDTVYDTCDLDTGNANQEVWGYKCFNSPVSFRNGLYGECSSLTTIKDDFTNNIEEYSLLNKFYGSKIQSTPVVRNTSLISQDTSYTPTAKLTMTYGEFDEFEIAPPDYCKYSSEACLSSYIPSNAGIYNFSKQFTDMQHNGSSLSLSSSVKNGMNSSVYYESKSILACNSNEDGIGDSAIIQLWSRSDTAESKINISSSVVRIDAVENVLIAGESITISGNVNISKNLTLAYDLDIDEQQFTSREEECLIIGNTRNNNSGALIVGVNYTYDTHTSIEDTIPITSTANLTSSLRDQNGDIIKSCNIAFRCYSDSSVIEISSTRCSLPTAYIAGDLSVKSAFKVFSDDKLVEVKSDLQVLDNDDNVLFGVNRNDEEVILNSDLVVYGTIDGVLESLCTNVVPGSGTGRLNEGGISFMYWSTNINGTVRLYSGDIITVVSVSNPGPDFTGHIEREGVGVNHVFDFYFAKGTSSGMSYSNEYSLSVVEGDRYAVLCNTDTFTSSPLFVAIMKLTSET